MTDTVYRTVFGISVGDTVRTSYGSGPYVVAKIHGPDYTSRFPGTIVIRTWPVISLVCNDIKDGKPFLRNPSYLNSIRKEGDRYITDQNDEIFVEKGGEAISQLSMFDVEGEQPYQFNPNVDYSLIDKTWRCDNCGDFNGEPVGHWKRADCPTCGRYSDWEIILMPPRDEDNHNWSDVQMMLGFRPED